MRRGGPLSWGERWKDNGFADELKKREGGTPFERGYSYILKNPKMGTRPILIAGEGGVKVEEKKQRA